MRARETFRRPGSIRLLIAVPLLIAIATALAPKGWAAAGGSNSPSEPGALDLGEEQAAPPAAAPAPAPAQSSTERDLLARAEKGDVAAQLKLGLMYIVGKEVQRNLPEGARWMRAAAEKGNAIAQFNMGALANAGLGVNKDFAEAAKWWRLSAEQGYARAQASLGYLYEHGTGVVQNFAWALSFYRMAVDQKLDIAQFNLGSMYEKGEGVTVDLDQAIRLYRAAAEKGLPVAQLTLADHYLSGKGVEKSAPRAYFWSAIAAARAPAALTVVATGIRAAAERQLKPEDITKIQELAGGWKPGGDTEALLVSLPQWTSPNGAGKDAPANARGSGTGFIVASEGMVVTNAHVVPDCAAVSVRTPDHALHAANLVNRDTRADLALLKIDGAFGHVATFREDRGVRPGDSVMLYGFPLTGLLSDQGSVTTGTVNALAGLGNDTHLIQISVPVQQGNSGGPLTDASGNVVGVVVSKLNAVALAQVTGDVPQNVNFAIKEGVVRDFLDANNVAYVTAKSTREIKPADLAPRIKEYTVQVFCQ